MIPAAPTRPHPVPAPGAWHQAWRDAVRDPRELLAMLGLAHLAAGLSDPAERTSRAPFRPPEGDRLALLHAAFEKNPKYVLPE